MIATLRTYRPGEHVNRLGYAFDFAADESAARVIAAMLRDAQIEQERAETCVPERDRDAFTRVMVEAEMARMSVLLLQGALAQAEAACASYPAEIVAYARERFETDTTRTA